jgi:amino acid transporter
MSKLEKSFYVVSLLYIVVCVPLFIFCRFYLEIDGSDTDFYFFAIFLPLQIFGMFLGLVLCIIVMLVLRDLLKREFDSPNKKLFWVILILLFWPSLFVYLPKYGYKSRIARTLPPLSESPQTPEARVAGTAPLGRKGGTGIQW